jgi:hypothetical protein
MVKSKEKTIEEILNKLDLKQKEITEKLRSLIKKTVPDAVEMVRQGKITYAITGKDFAWISQSKDHVDLDFVCGTRLGSAYLKGRGKGKDIRHIEINAINKMDEKELPRLLKDASELVC